MQSQAPVIRSYKGPNRRAAEDAYRVDVRQAAVSGWHPVAHRWQAGWDGHELSVVFEYRGEGDEGARSTGMDAIALEAALAADGGGTSEPSTADDGRDRDGQPSLAPDATAAPAWPAWDASPDADASPDQDGPPSTGPAAAPTQDVRPPASVTATRAAGAAATSASTAGRHARAILQTIDLHCAGEPLRLIRSGFPAVPYAPILERRRWVREHADAARQALMFEPRGHRDMYGAVLLPAYRPDADMAVLFMHNEGYSTMCGHGVIALTAALLEEGLYPAVSPQTTIRFETPAGLVVSTAQVTSVADGSSEVRSVRFRNVPAYLHAMDLALAPDGVTLHGAAAEAGSLHVDVAFGGAYYGVVDAADLGLRVVPESADALTRAGAAITELLRRDHTPTHPVDPDLGFIYGTIIVDADPATAPDGRAGDADLRNITVFAEAEVDRSPCGSGTSALLAQRYARGRVRIEQDIVNAGITGEAFRARVESVTTLGEHEAVVTSVEGTGYVTGYHTFVIDDRDPLGDGFLLR